MTADAYPADALDVILEQSYERFCEKVDEHGEGKNWLDQDAPPLPWHVEKARHHLNRAEIALDDGYPSIAEERFADALNHMAFALELAQEGRRDGGLREDYGPHTVGGDGDD